MEYDVGIIDDIITLVECEEYNGNFDSERIGEMLSFLSEARTRYTIDDLNLTKEEYDELVE